jgi:hypothetical protein
MAQTSFCSFLSMPRNHLPSEAVPGHTLKATTSYVLGAIFVLSFTLSHLTHWLIVCLPPLDVST